MYASGSLAVLTSTIWIALLWCSYGVDIAAATAASSVDLAPILTNQQWSSNTTISFVGSPEFFSVTERWTTFSAPTYVAAVSPDTEEDLIKVVREYIYSVRLSLPIIDRITGETCDIAQDSIPRYWGSSWIYHYPRKSPKRVGY